MRKIGKITLGGIQQKESILQISRQTMDAVVDTNLVSGTQLQAEEGVSANAGQEHPALRRETENMSLLHISIRRRLQRSNVRR